MAEPVPSKKNPVVTWASRPWRKKSCGDTAGLIQHQNSPEYQLVTVFPLCGECAKKHMAATVKKSCGGIWHGPCEKNLVVTLASQAIRKTILW